MDSEAQLICRQMLAETLWEAELPEDKKSMKTIPKGYDEGPVEAPGPRCNTKFNDHAEVCENPGLNRDENVMKDDWGKRRMNFRRQLASKDCPTFWLGKV